MSWAPTGNPSEVRFRIRLSFRRSEFGPVSVGQVVQENTGPTVLFFGDGDVTVPLFVKVTAISLSEDWFLGEVVEDSLATEFGILHVYPPLAAGPFTAFLGGIGSPNDVPPVVPAACCRIADPANPQPGEENLANRPGLAYPLQTLVFPLSGNSSPVSTMVPIVVVPPSTAATFLVPAVDPDGDALTWRLSTDAEAGGPAHPPGISVNSATGVVTWNNLTSGPGGTALEDEPTFWTTQFVIEDHDIVPFSALTKRRKASGLHLRRKRALQNALGPAKTKTPVDFLLLIQPQVGNLPSCSISPGGALSATVGNQLSFTVTGTDADPGDTVTLNTGGIPAGATLTPAPPVTGNSPQSTLFTWTPVAADVGAYTVIFSATDTIGQQGLCQTTIQVIDVNANAPTCSISAHPGTVQAGTPFTFTVTGADPDTGDTVTLDVAGAGLPSGATMTPALPFSGASGVTSTLDWTPTASQTGPFTFTFTATDSLDRQAQCQTSVEVIANPNPPTCAVSPPGPFTVSAGTPVAFTVQGTDPDAGDSVTLDLDPNAIPPGALPPGASMTPPLPVTGASGVTSAFAWTPTLADLGSHTIAFAATDSAGQSGSCQATVNVIVTNTNVPTCTVNPSQTVPFGTPVTFTVTGTDIDQGDLLDLVLTSGPLPTGASLTPPLPILGVGSPVSSTFNWIPSALQGGLHTFSFQVTDGAGHQASCGTTITVTGPPTCVINPVGPQSVPAGSPVAFTVTGTDPDVGDVLDLALTSAPVLGAVFTPALPISNVPSPVSSSLAWTPTLAQIGPNTFSFLVTDSTNQTAACSTTINVTTPNPNTNPPTCTISPHPPTITAGTPFSFTVTGTDPDLGDLLDLALTSAPVAGAVFTPSLPISNAPSPVSSSLAWTPTAAQTGARTFSFLVTDSANQTGTCSTTVTVIANPPTCTISPHPSTVQAGTPFGFTVTGTDPDLGDLLDLALTSALPPGAAMAPALPLSNQPSPVSSTLSWTPTAAQAGNHTFSYVVTDLAGQTGTCQTSVQVIANLPPTITCPGPVNIEGCNVAGGQRVPLTVHVEDPNGDALTVTWRVDGVVVQVDHVPAGGPPTSANVTLTHIFSVGTHTVQVTVSDGQATAVSCQTTVTIKDTRAPVLTCSSAQPMLWPPNHDLVNVGFRSQAADACDSSIVPVVGVFADEDDEDQTGDGHHSPDAKNIGSGTLRLRSERKGDADGRVYLMLAQGTDDSGNTGLQCCAVTVPHSQSKKDKDSVLAQAREAVAACQATGEPPPGFFVVGDGPILGPKQ